MSTRIPLFALWAGSGISVVGTTVTMLAIPWFVLGTTGSATQAGVVSAAELVGMVTLAALGGPIVDRIGARRIAIAAEVLGAISVAVIPMLHSVGVLRFWQLIVFAVLLGVSRGPSQSARDVLAPKLIARCGMPLERGASGLDAMTNTGRLLGAPLGGALLAVTEPTVLLLVDAGTFASSALLLTVLVPSTVDQSTPERSSRFRRYVNEFRDGARYLRTDRLMLGVVLAVFVTNLLNTAWISVQVPVYAASVLHSPVALGLISGLLGGGALLGNVVYARFGHRCSRYWVYAVCYVVCGAPRYAAMAVEPGLLAVLIVTAVSGVAAGALNPILAACKYDRVPPELHGRVFGLITSGAMIGTPLGALLGGLLVDHAGIIASLWIAGAVFLVASLAPLVFPSWREMDRLDRTLPRETARLHA